MINFSEAFYDSVINEIHDGVYAQDSKGVFVFVNDAFCAMTGFPKEKLLALDGKNFASKEWADFFSQTDSESKDAGMAAQTLLSLTHLTTGQRHQFFSKKIQSVDDSGRRFTVGIFRDVTDQVQMKEEVRKHRALLEAFYSASLGREERVINLKREVDFLKQILKTMESSKP